MRRTANDDIREFMRGDDGSLAFGSDPYYKIKVGVTCITVRRSHTAPPTFDGIAQHFIYGHSLRARARKREGERRKGREILALPTAISSR